jgi:hypothetical protein
MNRLLTRCPVCAGQTHVTEVACETCGTRVKSSFEPCPFCRLAPEQAQFVELFLRNRGNLSGLGDDLGISYPTVTKRLDAVLATLSLAPAEAGPTEEELARVRHEREMTRAEILDLLDRGEITADEATRRLQEL